MSVTRNPNLGPSQMKARRRRLFYIRSTIILFFLLVIIFGLAIFSGHEKVIVKDVAISGNAAVSEETILAIVNRDLAGRYWYLFARDNFLIFPRFQMAKDILEDLKIIKTVDISWAGWQKVSIVISERKPHSVWCGVDSKASDQDCYFMDKDGYIYSQAPDFTGNMFIRGYGSLTLNQLQNISHIDPLGSYFLPKNIYFQIFNLIHSLDQKNIKVIFISYDGFDYKFTLDSGPVIIFNSEDGLEAPFTNLFSALETKTLDLATEASKINYIDLRFDNKIVIGKK